MQSDLTAYVKSSNCWGKINNPEAAISQYK